MAGKRRIDRILAEEYLADLASVPLEQVREMRAECSAEEATVSYERRVLQGRMDLLRAELSRRESGDTSSLLDRLPQILADEGRGGTRGAIPMNEPDLDLIRPQRRVTKLVSNDTLLTLKDRSEDEIREMIAELEQAESEVSALRRPLHEVLDALNAEIARRYQIGEAQPSDVLTDI